MLIVMDGRLNNEVNMEKNNDSRRDVLKKGASFVLPAVATFTLTELAVNASGVSTPGSPGGGGKPGKPPNVPPGKPPNVPPNRP